MIKVGIIDNNAHTREAIKRILVTHTLGSTAIPITILFDLEYCNLTKEEKFPVPDVLLLDIEHQDTLIMEKVKKLFPMSEVIILTNLTDVKIVRKCFRNGAVSYLLKDTCMQDLVHAILITLNQGSFISPTINRALINQAFSSKKYEDLLTARELQVANGIVEGLSYKLIAEEYKISLDTVRIYIKRVYRKLNINSKGELISQLSM
ncbi:LuxR C-terminal-related transcriptional regulator [Sphingobacterium anhuiense]|uniref:LuxR C-terminal-related transcriptional regulator n=1 Tax=Sphingobacterium anhuiense TaxID=493780 RepID=A0ABW5YZ17_9SPHI